MPAYTSLQKFRSAIGIIERTARDLGVEFVIVEKPEAIHPFGIHATPAVVIDGEVAQRRPSFAW
ncbi:MAG: hypothetical protein ABI277_19020 [Burkholderiaceae bacterium]